MSIRASWIAAVALALGACGGAAGTVVVNVRDVGKAGDAPTVERVTDLGDLGQIPTTGAMPKADSDGQFVVGELILIEGDDFGKLPTVQIGGRPAAVEARTGGGGIVTRIPPGVPTGIVNVEVSHPKGKHARSIEVMRYGFVVQPNEGKLHVLALRAGAEPIVAETLDLPGVRDVAFSPDGQAAYALVQGDPATVAIIVTTSAGGPKIVRNLRLPMKQPMFLETAPSAPLMAVVDPNYGLLIDLQDPRTPALYEPFTLQIGPRGAMARDVALDAEGKTLAALVAQGNQIVSYDVSAPAAPARRGSTDVAPDVRHPVLRAFAYAPSGDQLWVVAGDTELSLAAGQHPTTIIAVDVAHGAGAAMTPRPSAQIAGAGAPLAIASSRRETVAPGTSIRSTAKTAAVVVSTVHPGLLALAGTPAGKVDAAVFDTVAEPGTVLRTDLEGEAQPLMRLSGVVTGLAVSYDSTTVAAATTRFVRTGGALQLEFGISFVPLAGGQERYVRLGDVTLAADVLRPAPVALAP